MVGDYFTPRYKPVVRAVMKSCLVKPDFLSSHRVLYTGRSVLPEVKVSRGIPCDVVALLFCSCFRDLLDKNAMMNILSRSGEQAWFFFGKSSVWVADSCYLITKLQNSSTGCLVLPTVADPEFFIRWDPGKFTDYSGLKIKAGA